MANKHDTITADELRAAADGLRRRGATADEVDELVEASMRRHAPLVWAIEHGQQKAALDLLERGSNPDERDILGQTALVHASTRGDLTLMCALVAAGASVDLDGPLVMAAQAGQLEAVRLLLELGADRQQTNVEGYTAAERCVPGSAIAALVDPK